MPSPAASPIPTWLLLVLMAYGTKRQRVDRVGSEAAGDGDECKGRDGEGCPFSTADHKQRRTALGTVSSGTAIAATKTRPPGLSGASAC